MIKVENTKTILNFRQIQEFYDSQVALYENNLDFLENTIRNDLKLFGQQGLRDQLPIYSLKSRIKSLDSFYLKAKREQEKIDSPEALETSITDFAGIRILCLFEDDIIAIHKYLVTTLKYFDIIEKEIYWPELKGKLIGVEDRDFKDIKKTGYKAIHYLAKKDVVVEIQLRTVLQDAWSELEHFMAYKWGYIHPDISRTYVVLSKRLSAGDELVNKLYEIRRKEDLIETKYLLESKPSPWLGYSDEDIPEAFRENPLAETYSQYMEEAKKSRDIDINKLEQILLRIKEQVPTSLYEKDPKIHYWCEMEKAYILMMKKGEQDLEEASNIYRRIIEYGTGDKYVPHFRLGEIDFLKNNMIGVLKNFDLCEELISSISRPREKRNICHAKLKMAYIYWRLGIQYMDLAIQKTEETKALGLEEKEIVYNVYNNLAYYYLEKYLALKDIYYQKAAERDEAFKKAKEYCDKIMAFIEAEEAEYSNIYDTAAWFCYHAYKKEGDKEYLKRAKNYIKKVYGWIGDETRNLGGSGILSRNMQLDHCREIMLWPL